MGCGVSSSNLARKPNRKREARKVTSFFAAKKVNKAPFTHHNDILPNDVERERAGCDIDRYAPKIHHHCAV